MFAPLILLFVSLLGSVFALLNPQWFDFLLLGIPCTLASLFLLIRAIVRQASDRRERAKNWVILDGSNVMYWRDNIPKIETVREVVLHCQALGKAVSVVFDANVGYLIADKYLDDPVLARMLGLPEKQVLVVPKGTPADPIILQAAREFSARIVTNDQFRDWVDDHPELRAPGLLITGGYRSGTLSLDMPPQT
ncbi:hypothetical protein LZG00_19860 [Rhodobacteraceae bacterium LMO-12]|nr:hypothetical protein [Rhodobacteraceae bacterium LMO-JJ12]